MPRILMVNVPYAGHINPTLGLAKALVDKGHEVVYVTAERFRDMIEKTGARFVPYADYPAGIKGYEEAAKCFRAAYDTALAVSEKFDALVYEMFFYPGLPLAQKLGVPAIRQFAQPAWRQESTFRQRYAAIKACQKVQNQVMSRENAIHMGVDHTSLVKAIAMDQLDLNIVYVPELFQPDRGHLGPNYVFTMPKVEDTLDAPPVPYDVIAAPRVYVSLGSIVTNKSFYRKCIRAFADKPMSVILNTGRIKPEELGTLPSNIHAYSYVPQVDVLRHSDVFVTHCGMNSINEAMSVGVPMVGIPLMNDEDSNADRIVELGIGTRLKSFKASGRSIVDAVRKVMDDPSMRQRSADIKQQLIGTDNMAEVVRRIEALVV